MIQKNKKNSFESYSYAGLIKKNKEISKFNEMPKYFQRIAQEVSTL